jgi:hypothetical protein
VPVVPAVRAAGNFGVMGAVFDRVVWDMWGGHGGLALRRASKRRPSEWRVGGGGGVNRLEEVGEKGEATARVIFATRREEENRGSEFDLYVLLNCDIENEVEDKVQVDSILCKGKTKRKWQQQIILLLF